MPDRHQCWVALSSIRKLVAADASEAAAALGGVDQLLRRPDVGAAAVFEAACKRTGTEQPETPPAQAFRKADVASARRIMALIEERAARVIHFDHPEYPALLRHAPDAPHVLFGRGHVLPVDERAIAVVGSREVTPYGMRVVAPLVEALVEYGCTIVSGMARGLDAAAHRAALRAGGRTLAVMGTAIDRAYPVSSRDLYRQIPRAGAVLSEYPPGTVYQRTNFLARNRIIAGSARALLVVEAGLKSGTSNTVSHALAYDRPVYAVPGDVTTRRSAGTNRMIVDQIARPIRQAEDLLRDLWGPAFEPKAKPSDDPNLPPDQMEVWNAVASDKQMPDHIAVAAGQPLDKVRATLATLEVAGLIHRNHTGGYVRGNAQ